MNKTWLSGTNVLSLITTLVSTLPQLRLLPRSRSTWNQHLYLWKASTSRGGGRREVGGEGDKQRADLAEETIRGDWRAEELHLCHQCSSEQTSVLEKRTEKDCNEPAFQSEIPSSKERLDKIKSYNDIDSFARDIGSQTQTKPTEVLKDLTSVIASSWASWTTRPSGSSRSSRTRWRRRKQQQVVKYNAITSS